MLEECNYKDDKKDGVYKHYYKNGNVDFLIIFKNDKVISEDCFKNGEYEKNIKTKKSINNEISELNF